MPLSWTARRQLFFFGIFAILVLIIVFGIIFYFRATSPRVVEKPPEEGKDLIVFWTRFFELSSGHYEVASLIENPNIILGTSRLTYRVRLYGENNILIALKEGRTFVNPREKFLIYEPDIETLQRVPVRAQIEFLKIDWKRIEKERPQLLVTRKEFENVPNGRVRAVIRNQSLFPVENIFVSAVLLDKDGNALGVSVSRIDRIVGEGTRELFFTWRQAFDPPPVTLEFLTRTNLTE